MRYLGKRRGAVLIVVLGVLAVLALLATTFATLQATEKQIARNYLDTVRAKLLAQSGVQDAEARLRDYFPFRYFETLPGAAPGTVAPRPWKFWGTSDDETKEPLPADKLELATNPSFAIEDESPQDPLNPSVKPKVLTIEGLKRGFSGVHGSGTYAAHGDLYALKVNDISGRLYVNDGVDLGKDSSVSQNMRRMLNILGDMIQVKELGTKILNARPDTGYRHQQDLLKAVGYDETLFARFKDYVTVHAWVDPNVANPVPLSPGMAAKMEALSSGVKYERSNAGYRYGSVVQGVDSVNKKVTLLGPNGLMTCPTACGGPDHEIPDIQIFGLDTLNPQWIEVVQRAPVNINAAPREVLVAVLTGLQGFFVSQRRRNNPRWKGDLYLSFKQQNNFRPKMLGSTADEYGWLMETFPIIGPGGTASDGVSAYDLADEIIACRSRKNTKWNNYSTIEWGGPFKTWNQFNLFIDSLVWKSGTTAALLTDTRPIHVDYPEEVSNTSGHELPTVFSDVQKEQASQAIADVIKANFNPNLHLNETNPDANLYTIVDKTDLLVNSTEFTFMPTGYFEIESLGRILRPKDAKVTDIYLSSDNTLVAQAKVTAVYKFYDLYRETSQRQFYTGLRTPGQEPGRTGAFETNNNLSLEVGPEPDNGVFPGVLGNTSPPDSEWGGYVALPTVGSIHHSAPTKAANTLMRTQAVANDPHFASSMHVHYQLDHDAHHHLAGRDEIAHAAFANEAVENYADYVGATQHTLAGPYNPTMGTASDPVRIARSFRRQKGTGGTVTMPVLNPFLASDLRIDGAYVERHSAPAYYNRNSAGIWNFGIDANASGQISMWVKPSFDPDLTGKVRSLWDMSRWHDSCGQQVNTWPWAIWYYPSNYQYATTESIGPRYWHNNQGQFQPSSLVFGSKQWHSSSSGNLPRAHEFGRLSNTLNHQGHLTCRTSPTKRSPLRGHTWTNVTVSWHLAGADSSGTVACEMIINGNRTYAPWSYTSMTGGWTTGWDRMYFFNQHDGGEWNHMRIGATSTIANAAKTALGYKGNYSGDHTVDELYVWNARGAADPLTLWYRGRYYKPTDSAYGEGVFTSQALALAANSVIRQLPPASTSAAGPATGSAPSLPALTQMVRILGMSWTWYGEKVLPPGKGDNHTADPRNKDGQQNIGQFQVLYDHSSESGAIVPKPDVAPLISLGVKDGSQTYGPFDDDGFSAVRALNGTTPVVQDPKNVKYFAQFKLNTATFSTILLATPVLDDVTIYWDDAQAHLLSYVFDGRTF